MQPLPERVPLEELEEQVVDEMEGVPLEDALADALVETDTLADTLTQ